MMTDKDCTDLHNYIDDLETSYYNWFDSMEKKQ